MGERELAEETGLARSAYISSESALRTELLLEEADDTEDTLLTDNDLHHERIQQIIAHIPRVVYLSEHWVYKGQAVREVFSLVCTWTCGIRSESE